MGTFDLNVIGKALPQLMIFCLVACLSTGCGFSAEMLEEWLEDLLGDENEAPQTEDDTDMDSSDADISDEESSDGDTDVDTNEDTDDDFDSDSDTNQDNPTEDDSDGPQNEVCDNMEDDDWDGLFDCEDSDCASTAFCVGLLDKCENSLVLEPGHGEIQGSTWDTTHNNRGSCGGFGGDRVYSFTIDQEMFVRFHLSGYDTVLYLLEECSNPNSEVGCNDDFFEGGDGDADMDLDMDTSWDEDLDYDAGPDTDWDTAADTDWDSGYVEPDGGPAFDTDSAPDPDSDFYPDAGGIDEDGELEAELNLQLAPGTYFLWVDGYNESGDYTLSYEFNSNPCSENPCQDPTLCIPRNGWLDYICI